MSREVCGICWCPYDDDTRECACEPEPKAQHMTDLRTAAQQALEALEQSETTVPYEGFGMAHRDAERKHQAAITALRAALAEPVQEPVAQVHPNHLKPTDDGKPWCREVLLYSGDHNGDLFKGENYRVKLYTAPPQRKPLTQEEIWHTYKNLWMFHPAEEPRLAGDVLKFARAIERAHNIT